VQVAVVVGDAGELAAEGLHLLDQVLVRVVAVGAAAHVQQAVVAFERDFGAVMLAPPRRHHGVAGDAFEGGGGGREAQVEVALFCRELAQGPYSNGVAGQAASCHCR
jgi:hypothetical protein